MKFKLLPLLAACLLAQPVRSLQAVDISYSNTPTDELYNSQGVALDSTFSFEMGLFINGFTPNANNISDWAANWIVFDLAFYDTSSPDPVTGGWNVDIQYFASNAFHQTNGTSDSLYTTPGGVFPQNGQAYLWVYNSKDITFTSEWALVTDFNITGNVADQWRFPNPADSTGTVITWDLADADTAIFGALHSGSSTGGGTVSNQPSSFSLQTYQVPEPGGALLVASAGLLLMLRRARFMRH